MEHRIINTYAPIPIEHLKEYFADKNVIFYINYKQSSIKDDKLITYLSNLEIPCDIVFDDNTDLKNFVKIYMESSNLINIPSIELLVMELLIYSKNIEGVEPLVDMNYQEILDSIPKQTIERWNQLLESAILYNLTTISIPEIKQLAEQFPHDPDDSLFGVNFLNLFKYAEFYVYYKKIDPNNIRYFDKYFNEYIFKGKNMFHYWVNVNNPIFLMTVGMTTQHPAVIEYLKTLQQETKGDVDK